MKTLALALCLFAASGCATMARGRTQPVSFVTVPEGAKVRDDATGETWQTPAIVDLQRRQRHPLIVTLDGYREERVYLRSEVPFQWWMVGALTLGISLPFDAILGGLYDLKPADVHVVLEREKPATPAPP